LSFRNGIQPLRNLLFHEAGTLPARSRFLALLRNDKSVMPEWEFRIGLVVVLVGVDCRRTTRPSSTEPKESLLAKAASSENEEKVRATLVESARQLD
jgi:hypothetical protein